MRAGRGALLAAALAVAGCAPAPDEPAPWRHEFSAFGSVASLAIANADPALAAQAATAVERLWQQLGRDWYAYGEDGELVSVNRALARGEAAVLSNRLRPVVARALELRTSSGGLFDPTVAGLVTLWGFADARAHPHQPPEPAAVAGLLPLPGLRLEGHLLQADGPVRLDLGGIGKGSALTAAARELTLLGIHSALLNAGDSSMLALGRPGRRGWRVAIAHPRGRGLIGVVELAPGEALATSGTSERSFVHEGQHYHHVLDPRTGQPAAGIASVTVLATDAELADAAATALLVAGAAGFDALLAALQLEQALLVTQAGEVIVTTALAARLRAGGKATDL